MNSSVPLKRLHPILLMACAVLSTACPQVHAQTQGSITTVAGNGMIGFSGDNGPATAASLDTPRGLAVDNSGNLYIGQGLSERVRKVSSTGTISTIAGIGTGGFSGDSGPAIAAQLSFPDALATDDAGNLYIADAFNSRIRKVSSSGVISTVAGTGTAGFSGDNGLAINAQIGQPGGITVDHLGNLYIADPTNSRVRKVDTNGIITTVAGNGSTAFNGDGGQATETGLSGPRSVAVDSAGNLYILSSNRVRKVNTDGIITTVAGNGEAGSGGNGGPATAAQLNTPTSIAVDSAGSLFIVDSFNNQVRKVGTNGVISAVAGIGLAGFTGDGGSATAAQLDQPNSIAIDAKGNLFISDVNNFRVREIFGVAAPEPVVPLVSVTAGSALPGQTITVEINADTAAQGVVGAQFTLQYGAVGSVGASSIAPGTLITGTGASVTANDTVAGQIQIGAIGTQPHNGPGSIVTFTLQVAANAVPGDYPLTLSKAVLFDRDGNRTTAQTNAGTLTITAPPPVPPSVTVNNVSGKPGDTVTLEVNADANAKGVVGAQLALQFGNVGTVDATGAAPGTLIAGTGASVTANDTVAGQVQIGAIGTQLQNGPGSIITIPLTIAANTAPGTYPITITSAKFFDQDGKGVVAQVVAGTVTVTNPTPPAPVLTVKSATGLPGQTVLVEIDADANAQGVVGAQLTVQFGAVGTVDANSVTLGTLIDGTGATVTTNDTVAGQVQIGAIGTKFQNGPGSIVTIPIKIASNTAPGAYPITITSAKLFGQDGKGTVFQTASGTVTVLPPVNPQPVSGDLNNDGIVNIQDVTLSLQITIGRITPTDSQKLTGDVNHDGKLNIKDTTQILQAAVGLVTLPPLL